MSGPARMSEGLEEARRVLHERDREPLPAGALDAGDEAAMRASDLLGLRHHRWSTVCPQRFVNATLADAPDGAREQLCAWAQPMGPRPNLLLLGPVGTGKTHLALASVREDFLDGLDVLFVTCAEMLDALRPGGPEGAMSEFTHVERLIVDDMGAERPTDWTAERLDIVVNRRWMEERPTIVTSNLTPKELADSVGERTYSRLVGSDAVVVTLAGKDRRRG